MARTRITASDVIDQAVELADEHGLDTLTLAATADGLGVQPSALYNHVAGHEDLLRELAVRATEVLAENLTNAAIGRAGDDAIRAIAQAYRKFATDHPGLYEATLRPVNDTQLSETSARISRILGRVVTHYGYTNDEAVHTARSIRSALHGFIALESTGGFPLPTDLDCSYADLVDLLTAGLAHHAER